MPQTSWVSKHNHMHNMSRSSDYLTLPLLGHIAQSAVVPLKGDLHRQDSVLQGFTNCLHHFLWSLRRVCGSHGHRGCCQGASSSAAERGTDQEEEGDEPCIADRGRPCQGGRSPALHEGAPLLLHFATAHLHQLMPPAACMRLETLPIVCSAEANIAVCKGPDLNVNNCLSAVKPLERQHLQCTTCHGMCMQSYWE